MELDAIDNEYDLLLKQIGSHLAEARKNKGVSQRSLGEMLGKNPAMIARVEKSGGRRTSLRSFYEVARSLGISLGEVIAKSEADLDFEKDAPRPPDERIQALSAKLAGLPNGEKEWFLSTIEGLLQKSSPLVGQTPMIGQSIKESRENVCASSS